MNAAYRLFLKTGVFLPLYPLCVFFVPTYMVVGRLFERLSLYFALFFFFFFSFSFSVSLMLADLTLPYLVYFKADGVFLS